MSDLITIIAISSIFIPFFIFIIYMHKKHPVTNEAYLS